MQNQDQSQTQGAADVGSNPLVRRQHSMAEFSEQTAQAFDELHECGHKFDAAKRHIMSALGNDVCGAERHKKLHAALKRLTRHETQLEKLAGQILTLGR